MPVNFAPMAIPADRPTVGWTIPDDVKRQLLAAQLLQQTAADTSQPVYTHQLGIAKLLAGGLGGLMEGITSAQEKRDQDKEWEKVLPVLRGGLNTGAGGAPGMPSSVSSGAPNPNIPLASALGDTPTERSANISTIGETGQGGFGRMGQIVTETRGSKSYGPFGLNTGPLNGNVGASTAGKFAAAYGPQLGLTAVPGTPEFDAQWRSIAQSNPEAFKNANMDWYQKNIMADVSPRLTAAGVPPEIASDPRVQGYFADRMIQQGNGSINNHAPRIAQALARSGNDPVAFMREMSMADRANLGRDFRTYLTENPNNMGGLDSRIGKREQLALALLNPGKPVSTDVGASPPAPMPSGQTNVAQSFAPPAQQPAPQASLPPQASPVAQQPMPGQPPQVGQPQPPQQPPMGQRPVGPIPPQGQTGMDPRAVFEILRSQRLPPEIKQMVLQQLQPQGELITTADGTIVYIDKKHPERPPIQVYQAPVKPVLKGDEQSLTDPNTGRVISPSITQQMLQNQGQGGQSAPGAIPPPPPGVDPKSHFKAAGEATGKSMAGNALPATQADTAELRRDFMKTQEHINFAQALPVYKTMLSTAGNDTRASDLNMVYGLAKIFDPPGVVREGEQVGVRNTASMPDFLLGAVNTVNGGSTLTPETRSMIMREAYLRMKTYEDLYQQQSENFQAIAKRNRMTPEDITPSFPPVTPWKAIDHEGVLQLKQATPEGLIDRPKVPGSPTSQQSAPAAPGTPKILRYNPATGKIE